MINFQVPRMKNTNPPEASQKMICFHSTIFLLIWKDVFLFSTQTLIEQALVEFCRGKTLLNDARLIFLGGKHPFYLA